MDENAPGSSRDYANGSDEVCTISEMLAVEDEAMEQVAAVFGPVGDTNCTYSQGYMKRQPIFACLTCTPEVKADLSHAAGICLACACSCHDGHDFIELYTKRNFRCDCGTKRLPAKCNLLPEKDDFNTENSYNQNYKGLYCTCSTIYPNPEDPIEDEMTQCIVCEDWYHSRHLNSEVPEFYVEMICEGCVKRNEFLLYYDEFAVDVAKKGDETAEVDVVKKEDETADVDVGAKGEEKVVEVKIEEIPPEEKEEEESICTKPKIKSQKICTKFYESFSWREKLCQCPECLALYAAHKVSFLIDDNDTLQFYEAKGKVNVQGFKAKMLEKETDFLNSLDRVPLMEFVLGLNDFKEHLLEYMQKFAENKKVIRVEDVQEFFSQLKSRKRQKTEMSYYCR